MGEKNNKDTTANQVEISVTDLKSAQRQLERVKKDLYTASKRLHKKNKELVAAWEGTSGNAFLQASFSLESELSDKIATLENLVSGINGTRIDAQNTDNEAVNQLIKTKY